MKCPECGEEMEEGTLRAFGRGSHVLWGPPNWGWLGGGGERIGDGYIQVDLPGFRCPKCKVIVLNYKKAKKYF